ncbi:MAG TPA: type IV pilus secretin PilQ [Nitrospira sp.]|nr:type IV pilus secretin PilQ [Nitrospira sp.]
MIPTAVSTAATVRVLSAIGALLLQLPPPAIGGSSALTVGSEFSPGPGSVPESQGSAVSQTRTITDIAIHKTLDDVTVVITGDGNLDHEASLVAGKRLVVDMPRSASSVTRPVLRVNHHLLKRIRFGYYPEKVRVVFDLNGNAKFSIESKGSALVVVLKEQVDNQFQHGHGPMAASLDDSMSIETAAMVERDLKRSVQRKTFAANLHPVQAAFQVRPIQMAVGSDETDKGMPKDDLVLGETRYVGRRISLDFQQADISNVLRLIAEVSGFNIVVGEGIKSKVTMKLVGVPWDQALDMILKMNGLGKIKQGNILWIDTLANIAKQEDEEARVKTSKIQAEPLVDRVFYIRNLQAQELMTSLRQNLSPRGRIQVSQTSNALIVQDAESQINILKGLIEGLDLALPEVQIEARVVEADTTYSRSLGIQWGVQNVNQLGNNSVANFKSGNTGSFGSQTSDFLVNLPATVGGLVSTPAAGFTIGRTDGALLDVRLSAGELLGLSKVIAAPKITTLDKREAKISQGESIPFQTTSLQGTQTTFVDANLELNVTPQITSRDPKEIGKMILMRVRVTRNAVGARSNPAGPSIDRKEANTQVIVRDGETMVIGGVFIDTQNNNVAGVPYLSRIPVLGWLFKQKTETVAKQELLIFLTPTIVRT